MLAELVNRLVKLGEERRGLVPVVVPGVRGRVYVSGGDGKGEWVTSDPPARLHELSGLQDVLTVIRSCDERLSVFVNPLHQVVDGVKYEMGIEIAPLKDEREAMLMPYKPSERWRELLALPRSFSPKQAVRFVRTRLYGMGPQVDRLLGILGKLDFTRAEGMVTKTVHGRESLGRSVEAAVQQADDVPQEFSVLMPLVTNTGLQPLLVPVRVLIQLEPDQGQVTFLLPADEAELAATMFRELVFSELCRALEPELKTGRVSVVNGIRRAEGWTANRQ